MSRRRSQPTGWAPPSSICPPSSGDETAGERHQRRLDTAVDMATRGRQIAAELGHRLELRNNGSHWQVRGRLIPNDKERLLAEWWPESGRFVPLQRYAEAGKAHDVEQFGDLLRRALAPRGGMTGGPATAPPGRTLLRTTPAAALHVEVGDDGVGRIYLGDELACIDRGGRSGWMTAGPAGHQLSDQQLVDAVSAASEAGLLGDYSPPAAPNDEPPEVVWHEMT